MKSLIMKCDFRNVEEAKKIIFKSRLSGEPLYFGFILKWERKEFVQFCKDQKLVVPFKSKGPIVKRGFRKEVYTAKDTFTYQITYSVNTLFGWAFEWIADWTGFRKRMLMRGFHYAEKATFTIGPRSPGRPNFNWMWVGKELMH